MTHPTLYSLASLGILLLAGAGCDRSAVSTATEFHIS